MDRPIQLGVYRNLANRLEGFDDNSPRALELHNLRRDALHSALGSDHEFEVTDWGQTDDVCSHEYVELLLHVGAPVFHFAVVPGLVWLGGKLAEKLVDATVSEAVKALIATLWPKQEAKQIQDIHILLPDGTQIRLDPPYMGGVLTVSFKDGAVQSVNYTPGM